MNVSGRYEWRKSSYSDNGANCIEIAFAGQQVAARDSKDPQGPALEFSFPQWSAFLAALNE